MGQTRTTITGTLLSLAFCLGASLTFAQSSGATLVLEWDRSNAEDLSHYNIYRSAVQGGPYSRINAADVTAERYEDAGLAWGTTFYYVVTAVDQANNESLNSTEAVGTTDAPNEPPMAVAGPDRESSAGDEVALDGSESLDADGSVVAYLWTQVYGPNVALQGNASAMARFVAPEIETTTTLRFALHVWDNDGARSEDPDEVVVVLVPPATGAFAVPIADAGADREVTANSNVTLDGSASSDPDGQVVGYLWTQSGGTPVEIYDPASSLTSFVAPSGDLPTTLTFELHVWDNGNNRSDLPGRVAVSVVEPAVPPVADAGTDQEVRTGQVVTLDGSASYDAKNSLVAFYWLQTGGPAVEIADDSSSVTTFVSPAVADTTTLTFQFYVWNKELGEAFDEVQVVLHSDWPTADAGEDRLAVELKQATLDGSNSSDPNGELIAFFWLQIDGPAVALDDENSSVTWFTAPEVDKPTTLTFELIVWDADLTSSTDRVAIGVVPAANVAPIANAGDGQWVVKGDNVQLNGSTSYDPNNDALTYSWRQTGGGISVALSGADAATPAFRAPSVKQATLFTFELTVSDGKFESTDAVDIVVTQWRPQSVANQPPTANAGPDQTVARTRRVTLDGSASSDPDGDDMLFIWEQIAGTPVELLGAEMPVARFTAPNVMRNEILTFKLTISDGVGTAVDTVQIQVTTERPRTPSG